MSEVLFSATAAAYSVACVLWLVYLRGSEAPSLARAPWVLGVGVVAHVLRDALRWAVEGIAPFAGIGPTLSTLALVIAASMLLLRRAGPRVDVLAAFALPVALGMLLGSRVSHSGGTPSGATFIVHVVANTLGVAAAIVACAVSIAYLLLERQVKAKRLGALFRRLPSLEQLETLSTRSMHVAIPALTVGIITGHVVAARAGRGAGLPWQQLFAMATWVVFVVLAVLRALGAWRGRRAMLGTLAGGAALLLTLAIYAGRG
ncbi:MAG: cytochrome c biogenesis protein CcsA [Myxococcales bacterium]|nr:cytochrome c biogenesis protein CcsA [Myxococcales bacterium]